MVTRKNAKQINGHSELSNGSNDEPASNTQSGYNLRSGVKSNLRSKPIDDNPQISEDEDDDASSSNNDNLKPSTSTKGPSYPKLLTEAKRINDSVINNSEQTRNDQVERLSPKVLPKTKALPTAAQAKSKISKSQSNCCLNLLLYTILPVFLAIGVGFLARMKSQAVKNWSDDLITRAEMFLNQDSAKNNLDLLTTNFDKLLTTTEINSNVPHFGKNVLKVAFERAVNNKQKSPVVLLLIGSEGQNEIVRNISHRIVNLMTTGNYDNSTYFSSIDIKPTHTERDIENFFTKTFNEEKQRVLLLENLEELNSSVAMTFHQFIDDENSRILDTFVIVTLKHTQKILVDFDVSVKQLSEISSKLLENLWKEKWEYDNLDCLINRIAQNTVVLVNK